VKYLSYAVLSKSINTDFNMLLVSSNNMKLISQISAVLLQVVQSYSYILLVCHMKNIYSKF